MKKQTVFRILTGAPKGKNTWEPDTAAKVQANLFSAVAMLVAENPSAEQKLMDAITEAKDRGLTMKTAV